MVVRVLKSELQQVGGAMLWWSSPRSLNRLRIAGVVCQNTFVRAIVLKPIVLLREFRTSERWLFHRSSSKLWFFSLDLCHLLFHKQLRLNSTKSSRTQMFFWASRLRRPDTFWTWSIILFSLPRFWVRKTVIVFPIRRPDTLKSNGFKCQFVQIGRKLRVFAICWALESFQLSFLNLHILKLHLKSYLFFQLKLLLFLKLLHHIPFLMSRYFVIENLLIGIDFLVETFQTIVKFGVFGFLLGNLDCVLHISWKGVVALVLSPKVGVIFVIFLWRVELRRLLTKLCLYVGIGVVGS